QTSPRPRATPVRRPAAPRRRPLPSPAPAPWAAPRHPDRAAWPLPWRPRAAALARGARRLPSGIDLHLLRLLRLVRVLRACVDLELPQLLARQAVAGKHPLDRLAYHFLGPTLEHLAEGTRAQSPGVSAVAVVQ